MQRCGRCGVIKPIEAFNRSSELGRQYYCRECQSAWYREHRTQHIANVSANSMRYRERNRVFIREYLLSHPCVDCGETNPALLEFDHQRDKLREVSRMAWSAVPLDALAQEIAKCKVRCANCHARRTAEQMGWRKSNEVPNADVHDLRH